MEAILRAKIAKYLAASAARCKRVTRKVEGLEHRLVRAQSDLAQTYAMATRAADQRDIDRVYGQGFGDDTATRALPDGDYSTLAEQVTFSPLHEDVANELFTSLESQAVQTQHAWVDYCARKQLLRELKERQQLLHHLVREKKGRWWAFKESWKGQSHLYSRYKSRSRLGSRLHPPK